MYDKNYIDKNIKVNTEILDEIDSTNEEAKRRILAGACNDFVLLANNIALALYIGAYFVFLEEKERELFK